MGMPTRVATLVRVVERREMTKKDRYQVAAIAGGVGLLACLEAVEITDFGDLSASTPRWILALVGMMFIALCPMVLIPMSPAVNHFFASMIIASMGVVFGWISVFGEASGFSGGGAVVAELTGFPLQRIIFGFGALFCFAGAAVAFVCFVRAVR